MKYQNLLLIILKSQVSMMSGKLNVLIGNVMLKYRHLTVENYDDWPHTLHTLTKTLK